MPAPDENSQITKIISLNYHLHNTCLRLRRLPGLQDLVTQQNFRLVSTEEIDTHGPCLTYYKY